MAHTGKRRSLPAVLLLGLVAVALAATGCGSGTAASPSPSASAGSTALRVLALKAYVTQLKPISEEVQVAVGSLDGAVSDLSKRPDKTWAASAAQFKTASAGLSTAASDLAAITPPPSLQGAQDGLVAALQQAQKVLDTTGTYVSKAVLIPGYPDIKTVMKLQVTDALKTAWAGVLSAVNNAAVPLPTATP